MPFPFTNFVLQDAFARAALGAAWTPCSTNGLKIDAGGTMITANSGADNDDMAFLNLRSWPAYTEVQTQWALKGAFGSWVALLWLQVTTSNAVSGYAVYFSTAGTTAIAYWRIDAGVFNKLGASETYTATQGDWLGSSIDPVTHLLQAHWWRSGLGWTPIANRFDNTYSGPFYFAYDISWDAAAPGQGLNQLHLGVAPMRQPTYSRPRSFAPGVAK